jgi:hypothetical protein
VYDGYLIIGVPWVLLHGNLCFCMNTLCACMDTRCASAWIPCVPLHVYHVALQIFKEIYVIVYLKMTLSYMNNCIFLTLEQMTFAYRHVLFDYCIWLIKLL